MNGVAGLVLLRAFFYGNSVTPDPDMVGQQLPERFDGLFRAILLHEREHRVYEYNDDYRYCKVQQPLSGVERFGYDAEPGGRPEQDSQEMGELGKEPQVQWCLFDALYLV